MNLSDCEISVRAWSCLTRAEIYTTEDLCNKTKEDMMYIRNLGRKSLEEILQFMKDNNLKFKE